MKEKTGITFSIIKENRPINGCTVSKSVDETITYFSLSKGTDISPEMYPYHKLIIALRGTIDVDGLKLQEHECILTPINARTGIKALEDAIYTEINFNGGIKMNNAIKAGEAFKLKDLLPYEEGKIINMDVVHNDKMKLALMSFSKGEGLSEHRAPGEALIFALDGKAIIGYEGEEHKIEAGENFHFAKGGLHSVKAVTNFKMALLLTLE